MEEAEEQKVKFDQAGCWHGDSSWDDSRDRKSSEGQDRECVENKIKMDLNNRHN